MNSIDIFVRYSAQNAHLDKLATLSKVDNLIYNDDGEDFSVQLKTTIKFAILTVTSPLISLVRLIRSVVFIFLGEMRFAGREFIGAFATPLLVTGCFLASIVSPIFSDTNDFYYTLRRTYGSFEAWIGGINLNSSKLPSFSKRVSGSLDAFKSRIWTTAPCMQPLLENGLSIHSGLLDKVRLQKMFPFIKVNDVVLEGGRIVIQSEYVNDDIRYTACNEACEHRRKTEEFCCCYRIEAIYDRFLCCSLGRGSCTPMRDHRDSLSIVTCTCCGIGACCCYKSSEGVITSANGGCFGIGSFFYVNGFRRSGV